MYIVTSIIHTVLLINITLFEALGAIFKLLLLKYYAPFTFSLPASSVIHGLNKKTLLLVLFFYHLK